MQTEQDKEGREEGREEGEESFAGNGEEEEEIVGLLEGNEAELVEAGLLQM